MLIEVLYFSGCPNHPPAVELAKRMATELDPPARVEEVEILSADEALDKRFLGSPSIRVDGVDIEPGAGERTDFGMSCRMYGASGMPPETMLAEAMKAGRAQDGASGGGVAGLNRSAGPLAMAGAVGTAALASACCWVPLGLLAIGVSSAGVAAFFDPLRPYMLGAAGLFLAGAFYVTEFRRPKCAPDGAPSGVCESPGLASRVRNRAALAVASVAVAVFALFPNYAGTLFGEETMARIDQAEERGGRVLTFEVEGMTCEACAPTAQKALGMAPGVAEASVDYETGVARVSLDADSPASPMALLKIFDGLGYHARVTHGAAAR